MTDSLVYNIVLLAWAGVAIIMLLVLFFVTAPYGRHMRRGWGPTVSNRLGWIVMEAPAPLLFALLFVLGDHRTNLVAIVFLVMWEVHYLHRAFVFPFRIRGGSKPMPVSIAASAFCFNLVNAYLQGHYVGSLGPAYRLDWLTDPRFIVGLALFVLGFGINLQSDGILRNLRRRSETGYKIPYGGVFRWLSCPNYFGEILEWTGWAVATWSLPGLVFLFWTAANLVPRARAHHQWYRDTFPDYPPERKAVLPLLY